MQSLTSLRYAIGLALLAALPAASQQNKGAPTQLYIDVNTRNMAGMPEVGGMLGGLGGMMAKRMGGDAGKPTYPTARAVAGMSGQYLDMALHNSLKPGVEAQDVIPSGLNLGKSLTLIPVDPSTPSHTSTAPGKVPDIEVKISEYWGCGATPRAGQPKVSSFKLKGGGQSIDPRNPMASMQGMDFQASGSLSKGQYVPDRDIDLQPGWVYWPNRKHGKQVPSGARLAGEHKISGDGIPASMQFQVMQDADFMPKLALRTQGEPTAAVNLSWPSVDRARAYFISGMHMQVISENSYALTLWSSAELPGAGQELHAYLSGGHIDKWLKQKILLPSTATACTLPKGIFAGASNAQGQQVTMPGMLMMTGYGPENWISYPPKPSDPKQPWKPEWSVRLRANSSATAMLGLDMGTMMQSDDEQAPEANKDQPKESTGKKLLKGILRNL